MSSPLKSDFPGDSFVLTPEGVLAFKTGPREEIVQLFGVLPDEERAQVCEIVNSYLKTQANLIAIAACIAGSGFPSFANARFTQMLNELAKAQCSLALREREIASHTAEKRH